jgi:hypothetical protein
MLNNSNRFTVSIIWLFVKKDMSRMADLDTRMRYMTYKQSVQPFSKKSTFYEGITKYFPSSESNAKALDNSKMRTGGIEAQRMPDLLFWFMFAIGTQGHFIPNVYHRSVNCNPTQVVMEAMACCVEVCWLFKAPAVLESHGAPAIKEK